MQVVVLLVAGVAVVAGQEIGTILCSGNCVGTWEKCAGNGIPSARPCCNEDDKCVKRSQTYGQCRPSWSLAPDSWPDPPKILTCEEPACKDEGGVVMEWPGVSAWRFGDNDDIELQLFHASDDVDCLEQCQKNPDCFIFEETADSECILYGKDLLEAGVGKIQPWYEGSLFFTKCYKPAPLCDPATREVRRAGIKGFYQEENEDEAWADLAASVAFDSCISICRQITDDRLGTCIGFALDSDPLQASPDIRCTPLYAGPDSGKLVPSTSPTAEVYSIEACREA